MGPCLRCVYRPDGGCGCAICGHLGKVGPEERGEHYEHNGVDIVDESPLSALIDGEVLLLHLGLLRVRQLGSSLLLNAANPVDGSLVPRQRCNTFQSW